MKSFFSVTPVSQVLSRRFQFPLAETEILPVRQAGQRILAEDYAAEENLPPFSRSVMDGYAVCAKSTFGACESGPQYLRITGEVEMGKPPDFSIMQGEAALIPTGGMLPKGADAVVMVEHTEKLDDTFVEIYKSVAPGAHAILRGEDYPRHQVAIPKGTRLRPQELGVLAALGKTTVEVYRKPVIAVISTGDEIVPPETRPGPGEIRDVNSTTLAALIEKENALPLSFGIVKDHPKALLDVCTRALDEADMVLLSGGSSVGVRDYTVSIFQRLPESQILAQGIAISPGKPTILAQVGIKAFWGLPGHVASAMIVFMKVVKPFIHHISGMETLEQEIRIPAYLTRNIASAQGRTDFVRVRLAMQDNLYQATPVTGKSGLIRTLAEADGLIEIDADTEGLDAGDPVWVHPV